MRKRLESSIESAVVASALSLWGVVGLKVQITSWPDRLFLFNDGRHLFIEFKRPDEEARGDQVIVHNRLRHQGHLVYVCDNPQEALCILHSFL